MCESLQLSWQPDGVCQATSFLAIAMVFKNLTYKFENASKRVNQGIALMRKSTALSFLTGVSNTFLCVCQLYSCGRNGKMALGPSLGDQSQSMIQLLFDSPVITCKQNQVSFIFREWGYLRCIPANTKCPSVTRKQGKQRVKTTRNRVSVIYICWPITEALPSLQSPGFLGQRAGKCFHTRVSVVQKCSFPSISGCLALILLRVQVPELLNPIR